LRSFLDFQGGDDFHLHRDRRPAWKSGYNYLKKI